MSTRKLTRLALLAAAALALGYVESLLPPLVAGVPGIKLGLANTVLLYALYLLDGKSAWMLMAAKVLLSALVYAGFGAALYSLGGGVLSLCTMLLVKKLGGADVSVLGVSVAGAACHNIGQLLVFGALAGFRPAAAYLPWLLAAAVVTGLLTGVAAKYAIRILSGPGGEK